MAHTVSTPGLSFHPLCARLGWKMLFGPAGPLRDRRSPLEMRWLLHMVFSPMVLTRYFEFDLPGAICRAGPSRATWMYRRRSPFRSFS